ILMLLQSQNGNQSCCLHTHLLLRRRLPSKIAFNPELTVTGITDQKLNETRFVLLLISMLCLSTGCFSKTFCYFTLIQDPKTWTEAQSYCKKYHTDLATIQSDEDRYKIQEIAISAKFQNRAWMGLYDGVFAWRWSYQDLNIDYKYWAPTEETTSRTQRRCGVIRNTGSWHACPAPTSQKISKMISGL
uniref:C-type lectin domain-containing protein n=1 Tax=Sinocyclocheilus grahami TaxID=75366 RepID=A0A672PIH6_SINGR